MALPAQVPPGVSVISLHHCFIVCIVCIIATGDTICGLLEPGGWDGPSVLNMAWHGQPSTHSSIARGLQDLLQLQSKLCKQALCLITGASQGAEDNAKRSLHIVFMVLTGSDGKGEGPLTSCLVSVGHGGWW